MTDHIPGRQAGGAIPEAKERLCELVQEAGCLQERAKRRAGRPCQLVGTHLGLAILLCLLRGWTAQRDVWRTLAEGPIAGFAAVLLSDEAVYKRLAQAGVPTMMQLFDLISLALRTRLAPYEDRSLAPFATEVLAVDDS